MVDGSGLNLDSLNGGGNNVVTTVRLRLLLLSMVAVVTDNALGRYGVTVTARLDLVDRSGLDYGLVDRGRSMVDRHSILLRFTVRLCLLVTAIVADDALGRNGMSVGLAMARDLLDGSSMDFVVGLHGDGVVGLNILGLFVFHDRFQGVGVGVLLAVCNCQ